MLKKGPALLAETHLLEKLCRRSLGTSFHCSTFDHFLMGPRSAGLEQQDKQPLGLSQTSRNNPCITLPDTEPVGLQSSPWLHRICLPYPSRCGGFAGNAGGQLECGRVGESSHVHSVTTSNHVHFTGVQRVLRF